MKVAKRMGTAHVGTAALGCSGERSSPWIFADRIPDLEFPSAQFVRKMLRRGFAAVT
jgi:hypothetical protein